MTVYYLTLTMSFHTHPLWGGEKVTASTRPPLELPQPGTLCQHGSCGELPKEARPESWEGTDKLKDKKKA